MDTSAPLSITPTNAIPAVQQILDRDTELRNLPRGLERERRSTTLREQIKQDIAQLASDGHKQLLRLLLSGIPFAEPTAAINVSLQQCHWSVSELDSLLIYSYRLQLCAEAYHTALRTCSGNSGYAVLVQRFLLELYARAYHSNLNLTRAGLVLMGEHRQAAQAFFAEQNETNLWHKIWVATDKQLDPTLKLLTALTNRPNPTHSDEPSVAWWEQWREAIACLEPSAGRALCQQIWMYKLSEYDFCDEPNERYWAWHYYATYGNAALWGITSIADDTTCAILGAAVPGLLRNNPTAGTIALKALGRIHTVQAHEQLQRLATQLKNKTALKTIATIRRKAAQQQGIDQDTLDDRVDARGLDTSGRRFWTLADGYTAALWLNPAGRIEVLYRDPDGRERSSCPKVVKAAATNTLAELRETTKYLRSTYAILRTRLELALIHQRQWDLTIWQETVALSPLFKQLAYRLIWQITTGDRIVQARPSEEGWVGTDDTMVELAPEARLTLAHPVALKADPLARWRAHIMRHQIIQPFKQLYREVYLLTPAEEETATYSQRFATQTVQYRMLYALLHERNWSIPRYYQGSEPAYRDYPQGWQARCTYTWQHGGPHGEVALIDQIEFIRKGERRRHHEPVLLHEVAPIVFSEAMRDLDLLVAVANAGSRADWEQWNQERRVQHEWESMTRARRLSATADLRATLVHDLLPGLKVRDRMSIDGHTVLVRGQRHSYRIHLGSGNVHIEPEGRYLCIVPEAKQRERLYLPFEDDDMKTAEILSKIVLLANDQQITDPSILRQL